MRKIISPDFFTFTKIIKKMGIREELKKLAKSATNIKAPEGKMTVEERDIAFLKIKEDAINEMEIDGIMIFIENIASAEAEVYKFIADISGKNKEELSDPIIFMESIQAIFEDEALKSFFKLALK